MIDQFLRVGATIDVFDATALAALDATGLTRGTVVFVSSLNSDFTLTLSAASLVPNQVVSVNGIDGYRWIIGGGGGCGTSIVAEAPLTLTPGAPGSPDTLSIGPWLNLSNFYVSTLGNDANDGKNELQTKKTIKAGLLAVVANGGGNLYVDDGCDPSDDGGNIAVRGDTFAVPGFVNIPSIPIRIMQHCSSNTRLRWPRKSRGAWSSSIRLAHGKLAQRAASIQPI